MEIEAIDGLFGLDVTPNFPRRGVERLGGGVVVAVVVVGATGIRAGVGYMRVPAFLSPAISEKPVFDCSLT
jgi:hypothetical protein